MAAPYWGQLPPPKVTRINSAKRSGKSDSQGENLTINTNVGGDRLSGQSYTQSQSRRNRDSTQTEAPTISTQSPFASPVASSFRGDGLAPRPASFGYTGDFAEKRKRRESRNKEQYYDENPPPAAPDVPRAPPPLSYKQPYSNGAQSSSYQPSARSRSTRRSDGPLSPGDSPQGYNRNSRDEFSGINRTNSKGKGVDRGVEWDRDKPERLDVPRKGSISEAEAQRRREWALDRSPLQRLELTLDSITKEEKRARVEEAELVAREAKAGRGGERASQNSVRFRNRPVAKAPEPVSQSVPQTLPEAGLVRNLSNKQKDQLQRSGTVESKRPAASVEKTETGFDYQPRSNNDNQSVRKNSIPQRGPSIREPSAIPIAVGAGVAAAGLARSGSNKLKKDPPGDPWLTRRTTAENQYKEVIAPRRPSVDDRKEADIRTGREGSSFDKGMGSRPQKPLSKDKELPSIPKETRSPVVPVGAFYDDSDDDSDLLPVRRNSSKKIEQLTGEKVPMNQQQKFGDQARGSEGVARSASQHKPGMTQIVTVNGMKRAILGPVNNGDSAQGKIHQDSHAPQVRKGEKTWYQPESRLDEWKTGGVVMLDGNHLDLEPDEMSESAKDKAWWEAGNKGTRRRSSTKQRKAEAYDGEYDTNNGTIPIIQISGLEDSVIEDECEGCVSERRKPKSWLRSHVRLPSTRRERHRRRLEDEAKSKMITMNLKPAQPDSLNLSAVADLFPPSSTEHILLPHTLTCRMRPVRVRPDIAPAKFRPPLFLKCGPLLRYVGLRRERKQQGRYPPNVPRPQREIWRGSVMIVTEDSKSSYELAPTLRLFLQPIDLLPPPPAQVDGEIDELAPEYIDPIAGLPKIGRDGKTLYVRPVDHLQEMKDLSRDESDEGLFEEHKSPLDGSADPKKSPKVHYDGEKAGKYREVRGFRLHVEHGVTFWKFNIEIELREKQQRIAYRINRGPATGFWVPARDQAMNIMFYSCNGFSHDVDPNHFSGPDPMWRDVLNTHQTQPFHVMLGGGDQLYMDAVEQETKHFKHWTEGKDLHWKEKMTFPEEMHNELEQYFLDRYSMWYSQGLFGLAVTQIPMINIWDDHDLIDGYGSYPNNYMSSPVMSAYGSIAFKYYLLFQHQTSVDEGEETEPSWILGAEPGPFIKELSRSIFTHLGRSVAFLGLDCRTERKYDEVVTPETYDRILDRLETDIIKGETKHLIVMLGIPMAYPRMVWLENILTSRVMIPVKALGRIGLLGKEFLNHLDGGVEILDDLDDHWTAKHHKDERHFFIDELQNIAAEKSVRITILGGDVHLGAIGQFYSNPKLNIPKDRDHRYMPNVISSAIVNAPPPDRVADLLNQRNKVHHLDKNTDEDMIPIFTHDVNGKPRNNKRLLNRRNWCSIREYDPELTPPPTPDGASFDGSPDPPKRSGLFRRLSSRGPRYAPDGSRHDTSHPPLSSNSFFNRGASRRGSTDSQRSGILTRSLSLTRNDFRPGNLFRRKSKRKDDGGINGYGADSDDEAPYHQNNYSQNNARSGLRGGGRDDDEGYFPSMPKPLGGPPVHPIEEASTSIAGANPRSGFRRTVTQERRGKSAGEVNLEGGLDICLHMEVNSKNPDGITTPYRLLVPRLWYEEEEGHAGEARHNLKVGLHRWAGFLKRGRDHNTRMVFDRGPSIDEEREEGGVGGISPQAGIESGVRR